MAEPYLTNLTQLVDGLESSATLETKHFFSGAALYANGKICASLSPAGFALKLPEDTRRRMMEAGDGAAFRFFANGPIKHEYVALSEPLIQDEKALRKLLGASIMYVLDREAPDKRRLSGYALKLGLLV